MADFTLCDINVIIVFCFMCTFFHRQSACMFLAEWRVWATQRDFAPEPTTHSEYGWLSHLLLTSPWERLCQLYPQVQRFSNWGYPIICWTNWTMKNKSKYPEILHSEFTGMCHSFVHKLYLNFLKPCANQHYHQWFCDLPRIYPHLPGLCKYAKMISNNEWI